MEEDWLEIALEFSICSRQNAGTAENNVMRLLLKRINNLLSITRQNSRRIWTLHKIIGNQVIFYKSNEFKRSSAHHNRDPIRDISKGLIGKAIQGNDDVVIFPNATQEQEFIQGWENCQSELIALVRNSANEPIGVINIESEIVNDFFYDENEEIDHLERENLTRQLKRLVVIASNHLSLIFRNQFLAKNNQTSNQLIEDISASPISSYAQLEEVVESLYVWLKERTEFISAFLYIKEPETDNQYVRRVQHFALPSGRSSMPNQVNLGERINALLDPGIRNPTRTKIQEIFGDNFANTLLNGNENVSTYFYASEVLDNLQNLSGTYFSGIVLASPNTEFVFAQVQRCFEVLDNLINRYFRNKFIVHKNSLQQVTIEIYENTITEKNFRTFLNKIAGKIAEQTDAKICSIYLVAPEEYYHSRHIFYLGGVSKKGVDFADIRFSQKRSIVNHVMINQEKYYHSDFYNCDINTHSLDQKLQQDIGLEKPEVYALPLLLKPSKTKIGAIVLFRENSETTYQTRRPSQEQVNIMLDGWSEHLSRIIHTEKQKQADSILAEAYKKLIDFIPRVADEISLKNYIVSLQKQVSQQVLPLWRELLNPAYFVVYQKSDQYFELLDTSPLPINTDVIPKFEPGQGLTGSVHRTKDREIYEPFIEDFDQSRNINNGDDPLPDGECKSFWDRVLGDQRRSYYGRHIVLGQDEYVLVIVGVRQNKFLPPLGYSLVHNLVDTICKHLQ